MSRLLALALCYFAAQWSKIRKKCNFKSTKTHYLHFQKWQKINFCTRKKSENQFLVVLNFFLVQKLIFLPFLKYQKMCFCTLEIALFFEFWSTVILWGSIVGRMKTRSCTMFDFQDFGLIFAGQMHCLPQRLKSMLFEIFSNRGCPKGTWSVEKISNNIDFSLWGNRATTWEYFVTFSSETKIMKITHSE